MSLIDKQLRAAKLQREFAIKIEEQTYKSFNGPREAARNFGEGTLNIGQCYDGVIVTCHNQVKSHDRIRKEKYSKRQQRQNIMCSPGLRRTIRRQGLHC